MADLFLPACWPRMELPRADAFQLPFPWKTNCVPRSVSKCLLLQYRTRSRQPSQEDIYARHGHCKIYWTLVSAQHPYVVDNVSY